MARLDEKIDALDEETRQLRAMRLRVERDQRASATGRDVQRASTERITKLKLSGIIIWIVIVSGELRQVADKADFDRVVVNAGCVNDASLYRSTMEQQAQCTPLRRNASISFDGRARRREHFCAAA